MPRDFRKQYYSNIGVIHDDPKFKEALGEKVVNVPLLKQMVLRMGLPMSCRAEVWRLLLLVAQPDAETWPVVMAEFQARYTDLQACARACQVWQNGASSSNHLPLQAVRFALLQVLHISLRYPLRAALPSGMPAPSAFPPPSSPLRRHSGGGFLSARPLDQPPRFLDVDPLTEVALKARIGRAFAEVFDEEYLAYFAFSAFVDFVQGDHPSWAAATLAAVQALYRLAADHCKEMWCSGSFFELRLQQKDEMDLLLRDVLGSAFACHLERRHLLPLYDMLLCYSADFLPYVAAGLLKVGWMSGPLKQCRTVADVRQVLGERNKLNQQEVVKLALSRAKEWYLSSSMTSKAAPLLKPPVGNARKKPPVQFKEVRLPESEAASITAFRKALASRLPPRPGAPLTP